MTDDLADEIVTTAGVTSHVYAEGEVVGHVLLLDLDASDPLAAHKVADALDGVTALFESSEGSYHVWSLSVDAFRERTLTALSYRAADDAHAGASWRRGYSVLRFVSKVREDGETYKERPTLLDAQRGESDRPQSAAHLAMLESIATDQGVTLGFDVDAVSTVGDADDLRLDSYQTLSDDGKEAVQHG